MRHWFFILAVLWFLFGSAASSYAGLRVATYNLNNYLIMDRQVTGRWQPDYPKPENEKAHVRRVILKNAPDILALQEIGTVDFLEELRADLTEFGLHYPYMVHLSGPDPVRHLAVLSKVEPLEVRKHTELDFKYFEGRERVKRGLLEMSFQMGEGERFKLFVVHLKSRYSENADDPDSGLRRTREAQACRDRVIERTLDLGMDAFLIAGDFNDGPATSTMRRFYRRGDLMIGSLLRASDQRGEMWTYYYEKNAQYSLVDGFIVSRGMARRIASGRGFIEDMPGALIGSDHRMVYLDLMTDSGQANIGKPLMDVNKRE